MKTIEIYVKFTAKVPDDVAVAVEEGKTEPFFVDLPLAQCQLRKSIHKQGQALTYEDIESRFCEYEVLELERPQ